MKTIKRYNYFVIIFVLFLTHCDDCNNMEILLLDSKSNTSQAYATTDTGELEITAFSGSFTASENYDYYSNSAHIKTGPIPQPEVSKIYLFQGTDGLHVFFFHNCDECNFPNTVVWTIVTRGNNLIDDYVVQDDSPLNDTYSVTSNLAEQSKEYHISQRYKKNSDGGVIGPFENSNFSVTIYIDDPGNITSTVVESANGQTLEVTDEVTISL